MAIDESKILTLENIFTKAQDAASIGDGDYIYFQKSGASTFSRIEKSLFLAIIGSGISTEMYNCIKNNVDAVQEKVDEVIGVILSLANYAFPEGKPSISAIGELDWSDAGGGDMADKTPILTSPSESGIDVGTITSGTSVTKTVRIKGKNITQSITLAITGSNASQFALSQYVISASDVNAGKDITVTFSSNTLDGSRRVATMVISGEVSKSITLTGTAGTASVTLHTISLGTMSNCSISKLTGIQTVSIEDGASWNDTLSVETGYVRPNSITINGSYTSLDYNPSTGAFTIYGISSDITISASATQEQSQGEYITDNLLLHLDGKNQGNMPGKWIDLAHGYEFVLHDVGAGDVESDGVTFAQDNSGTLKPYGVCDSDALLNAIDNNCTVEVCFTALGGFVESQKWRTFFITNAEGKSCFLYAYGQYKHLDFQTASAQGNYAFNCGTDFSPVEGDFMRVSMNSSRIVVNGVEKSYAKDVALRPLPADEDYKVMIGSRITTSYGTSYYNVANAKIHSIRVYNGQLSAAQMIANQTVDNNRFGQ